MHRVLIADDNPLVGQGLGKTLAWEGLGCHFPLLTYDGDMARLEIEDLNPDLVISDIRMPGMDGLELLEWFRKKYPGKGFIVITGFDEFPLAQKALKLGADDLIIKPINNRELEESIRRVLNRMDDSDRKRREISRYRERIRLAAPELRIKVYRDLLENDRVEIPKGLFDLDPRKSRQFLLAAGPAPDNAVLDRLWKAHRIRGDIFSYGRRVYCLFFVEEGGSIAGLEKIPSMLGRIDEGWPGAFSPPFSSLFDLPENLALLNRDEEQDTEKKGQVHNPLVLGALGFLSERYADKIGLDETARFFKVSGAHLTRILKKETGHSFNELLSRLRIAHAIRLLGRGELNVSEAGTAVGLPNYAHFYQVFKKITGFSPREFPYGDRGLMEKHSRSVFSFFSTGGHES